MIIGKFSCYEILPILYTLSLVNILLSVGLIITIIVCFRKSFKENGIIAKMIHKISGDFPN